MQTTTNEAYKKRGSNLEASLQHFRVLQFVFGGLCGL